jgi:hypothetical protein
MSISRHFSDLGAPLKNIVWSWGAVSEKNEIFLRVWQDQVCNIDGSNFVRLTDYAYFEGYNSLGFNERQRQIEKLRKGCKGFIIFCVAQSTVAARRRIQSYVKDRIFPTGEIIEIDGDVWVEFTLGVRVKDFLAASERTYTSPPTASAPQP